MINFRSSIPTGVEDMIEEPDVDGEPMDNYYYHRSCTGSVVMVFPANENG